MRPAWNGYWVTALNGLASLTVRCEPSNRANRYAQKGQGRRQAAKRRRARRAQR